MPSADPIDFLFDLADSCDRTEDAAFWILTSAAAHLTRHADNQGSIVAHYFPEEV